MAFNKQKHYDSAIQKVTITFGKELNLPEGEECYVKLREPSEIEVAKLRAIEGGELSGIETFKEILSAALVDHDFFDGERKMTADEVIGLLYEKVDTATKLIKEYTSAVFPSPANKAEGK